MKTVIIRANQDIYDVCIQEYGSLEFLNTLIIQNSLNFNGEISQGQTLQIDETIISNQDIKDFFELKDKFPQNNYIYKNNIPPLNFDNTDFTFDDIVTTWDLIKI